MRRIVAGLSITLDGVVEAAEKWNGPYFSQELGQEVGSLMMAGDTLLVGRHTYEYFVDAFAGASGGEADMMHNIPKVVVSSTMKSADWQNSTLINDNVAEQLAKLKEQPGKNINVSGSGTLIRWLLHEGLLDELNLFLYPVAVGSGKRLFEDLGDQVALELTGSKSLAKGVLHLTYQPA